MEVSEFDPKIVWFDKTLTPAFCQKLIRKFNQDKRPVDGVTIAGYVPEVKQSKDLHISPLEDWKEEDELLFLTLNKHLKEYLAYLDETFGAATIVDIDTGYQIQKTASEGFYHWHHDFMVLEDNSYRNVTYIWYLNSPRGGHTEFCCGERVQPVTGRLLLFPATWDRWHRGTPPETVKYICTGWTYQIPEDMRHPTESGHRTFGVNYDNIKEPEQKFNEKSPVTGVV